MTRPIQSETLASELARIVGSDRVSILETDLDAYSRDMWPRLLLGVAAGAPSPYRSHAVVWPTRASEVAAIVRYAASAKVPIVPYGGGSGVCGGAVPTRGGITVDLKQLNTLRDVSREEMICDVDAGINGERLERALASRGYTLGHFPSSIYCSTLGGWLACRAAGQMSTKYGKIEDRVAGLTVVTGRGEIIHTDELARATRGPNWTQLLVGSEGTLGIITSARMRVAVAPALRLFRGYEFENVKAGTEAIRRVMQRGLQPAVVRLYDGFDTFINNVGILKGSSEKPDAPLDRFAPTPAPGGGALPSLPSAASPEGSEGLGARIGSLLRSKTRVSSAIAHFRKEAIAAALRRPKLLNTLADGVADRVSRSGCRMIVGLEGALIRTEVESRIAFEELERAGGLDLGEDPGLTWFEHRYAVSYKMSSVFRQGAFVDTMEVAATWSRLGGLYREVREAIGQHALVMAHFSHAYSEGCSIYFTFVARGGDRASAESIYDAIWRDGMAAATRAGGTISHHHGVGLLKAPYMRDEHREAMRLLAAVKESLDPAHILNPGKLGLGEQWDAR